MYYILYSGLACLIIAVVTFICRESVIKRTREMELERCRLECVLANYNRVFNDDYKPF